MHKPKSNLIYWFSTAMVALNWSLGGMASVLRSETSLEVYRKLGYPEYFPALLGIAQLLGVAAILLPVPARLREWAYAGLVFDATAATISFVATRTPIIQVSFPLMALGLVFTSYRAWVRRTEAAKARIDVPRRLESV